jgi:hypothetical protein
VQQVLQLRQIHIVALEGGHQRDGRLVGSFAAFWMRLSMLLRARAIF